MTKSQALLELARLRQQTKWDGYKNVGDYYDGVYDCDFVSPYTKGAGNVDSDIMLILRDWSSDEFLRKPVNPDVVRLGRTPTLPTNRNLIQLLQTHFNKDLADVYATNLFPFIKQGSISQSIPVRDLIRAAEMFAVPQIEIVQPRLVICFGLDTFNAVKRATGYKPEKRMADAIARPFQLNGKLVYCQSHPGALGKNNRNRGGVDRVTMDWQKMMEFYQGG